MLRFVLILAATSSLLYRADAFTPTADQKLCAELPANADVVAACTRIIEATNSSTLDRAVSHTFRADAARADGNTAATIADYNQALALMPTLVPALSGRGIAYRNAQKYDLSLHDFDQAIAIEPNNAGLYNSRGVSYRMNGDSSQAMADFSQAIKLEPDNAVAFNGRGNVYADIKQPDQAIADFTQAIKLDRAYGSAYFNRGSVEADDKDQLDKAIADFSTAIKLDSSNTDAYVSRAVAYIRKNNTAAALADLNTAIGATPDLERAHFYRGILHFNTGDDVDRGRLQQSHPA